MKTQVLNLIALLLIAGTIYGQSTTQLNTKNLSEEEMSDLMDEVNYIAVTDQLYRFPVASKTTDFETLKQLKTISKTGTIEEYLKFEASLALQMTKEVTDSLWRLQWHLDEVNHLKYRELVKKYGYPSKELVGKNSGVLFALILHPGPKVDIQEYIKEMTALFEPEIEAGRMPAEDYAKFYDNMQGKILRKPQLYGTNFRYDQELQKILPPLISDIEITNSARLELGLEPLKEGEYELVSNVE